MHRPAVASLLGPVHGCAYLFVLGASVRETRELRIRLLAVVPCIGGLLVVRRLRCRAGGDVSMSATGR